MKTWKPDTCQCHIEEIYAGTAIIGGGQVLFKCSAHLGVADVDLYGVLYANTDGENKRKNRLRNHLVDNFVGKLSEEIKTPSGAIVRDFKAGVEFSYTWTGVNDNRVLVVTLTGAILTVPEKAAVGNAMDGAFGAGKVVLVN